MIDSWLKAVSDGKLTGCVKVDFRKVFDLVVNKILLNKLKCLKCNEKCLSWFESYLSSRTECVSLNNTFQNLWRSPRLHFRPFTFLIFINDVPLALQNSVVVELYADDTTFYDFQSDVFRLETNLQHALNLLHIWCQQIQITKTCL